MAEPVRLPDCYIVLMSDDDGEPEPIGVIPCNRDSLAQTTDRAYKAIADAKAAKSEWDSHDILVAITAMGIPCCSNVLEVNLD